ncbi:RHS repeat-associated core domain-containing protein, partial [Archangium sp.]|uniref:RHS repeat-associated core domain-containing protein n=1 Tax=Archangium sp. TaxID=1872627 RepID=UPI002EDB2BF6
EAEPVLERKETRKYDDPNHTLTITRTIQTGPTPESGSTPPATRTESETLHVDTAGRVLKVVRTFDGDRVATHEYRYNERGQVRWHKSPEGAVTEYRHDPVGNLVQLREPADSSSGTPLKTTYLLHGDGQVWAVKGPHPGFSTTFTYDKFGELKSKTAAAHGSTPEATWTYETTANPGEIKETMSPEGVVTTRRFNARGRLAAAKVQGAAGVGTPREATIAFDGPWELRRTVKEGSWTSKVETTERDDLGRPLEEAEEWTQTDRGLSYRYTTSTVWTQRNATIQYNWKTNNSAYSDGNQQRSQSWEVSVDSLGHVVRYKPASLTHTNWWLYDADGKLAVQKPAGRPATEFKYDQGLLRTQDYAGELTRYTYDLDGRLERQTEPGENGRTRTYAYYARGVLKSETYGRLDAEGDQYEGETQRTDYTYDATSGLLKTVTQGAQGAASKVWTYDHGARGELLSVTMPDTLGSFTYTYDGLLRLKSVTAPGTAQQGFTYDFAGRITERWRGDKNAFHWRTEYSNGEVTTTPYPASDDDTQVETTTLLDGRGRVAQVKYKANLARTPYQDLLQVDHHYNGMDQSLTIGELRVNGGVLTNAFQYDERGLLTSVTRGTDTVTYAYKPSGQRERVTVSGGGSTRSVGYSYDAKARLSGITPSDPSRSATEVSWEPDGERIRRISDGSLVELRCYDTIGRISAVINASGSNSPSCENPFGNALAAYKYTYDARGNRLTEETRGSKVTVPGITEYGYDGADRLTGVRYPGGAAVLYSLKTDGTRQGEKELTGHTGVLDGDAYGMIQEPARHWTYGYDARGVLESITDAKTGGNIATITTDRFGQVQRDVRGLVKTEYQWDPAGRIAGIDVSRRQSMDAAFGPPTKASYTYDYAGLRRKKSVGTDVTSWLYVGDELVEERLPGSNGPKLMYERAGGLVTAVGSERILHDGLGSAVGRVGAGSMAPLARYDTWGGYLSGAPGTGVASMGYTGHAYDADVGLTYAQQRWLDTSTGRFLSEDPVGAEAYLKTPQGLNPWIYANGNPTRYTDPDGRMGTDTIGENAEFDCYALERS